MALLTSTMVACTRTVPPKADSELPPLVEVNLSMIGGPLTAAGSLEATIVHLHVLDGSGEAVHFNEDLVAVENGESGPIVLAAGQSIATLYLFEGNTYTFMAHAMGSTDTLLAYGTAERTVVAGGSNALSIQLLGQLGEASLRPRLPVNQLLPGQVIDLMLEVSPPDRDDLRISPSDFATSYVTENGTNIDVSSRGVRLRAGTREAGDLVVTASATGQVTVDGASTTGSRLATLRLPFVTGISVDTLVPELSTLAFDQVQQIFTGVAEDNYGIGRVDIFEGPKHLATTDAEDIAALGLSEITFPGGGTAFHVTLDLASGTYELTVIATDTSGLETRAELNVQVN